MTIEERFLSHVDKGQHCWLWTAQTKHGYGYFSIDSKPIRAHRMAYELWRGPVPEGMLVRHICHVRHCVNPAHLEVGTQKENMADGLKANRNARGERIHQSRLTADQVAEIRMRYCSQDVSQAGLCSKSRGAVGRRRSGVEGRAGGGGGMKCDPKCEVCGREPAASDPPGKVTRYRMFLCAACRKWRREVLADRKKPKRPRKLAEEGK